MHSNAQIHRLFDFTGDLRKVPNASGLLTPPRELKSSPYLGSRRPPVPLMPLACWGSPRATGPFRTRACAWERRVRGSTEAEFSS